MGAEPPPEEGRDYIVRARHFNQRGPRLRAVSPHVSG